ncbi:unnamed protein product [Bursaphelenchus xylophilus]|uniref:(pine wood nematode) hypothetical protein n=1 Tax=Bursaphelenchus xylophilus TaxID=6326 RepID=A0A1I7RQY1_BURXY|nr:unnamed protein product [Bursaphelenchus xylophilus]CAG9130741.1 unnamed protein product [Bursaphelenchus xylophilus]
MSLAPGGRDFYPPTGYKVNPLPQKNVRELKSELHRSVLEETQNAPGYRCGGQRKQKWVVRCASCQLVITREQALKTNVVYTLNKFWHRDHLTCVRCNAPVGAERLEFRQCRSEPTKPICIDCYMDENHPNCDGCHRPLQEKAINAMGHQWHKCCFLCTRCRSPMPNNEFYVLDGQPYDVDCYFIKKYEKVLQIGQAQSPAPIAYTSDSSSTVVSTASAVNPGQDGNNVLKLQTPREESANAIGVKDLTKINSNDVIGNK